MRKLQNPFGNKVLYLTQTLHSGSNNMAIDLVVEGMSSSTPFNSMSSGKTIAKSNSAGSYICKSVDGAPFNEFYVHTARWNCNIGDAVSTGQQLGYIATKAENGGYPMHIHLGLSAGYNIFEYLDRNIVFKTKYQDIANECFKGNINNPFDWSKYRDLSLDSDNMDFKIGDKIIFTGEENIRKGSGLKYDILSSSFVGLVGIIKDGPRIVDGYTWYDIQFENGSTGWVADVGKFEKYTIPPSTPPNATELEECQKEVTRLEQENKALGDDLVASNKKAEDLKTENEQLKNDLKIKESELALAQEAMKEKDEQIKSFENIKATLERTEKEKLALEQKLSEIENEKSLTIGGKIISWIYKMIHKGND